jgi:hypothetical protein
MGEKDENGVIHYPQKKVLLNTLFFVIGISFAFFLLGFGLTALGKFFSGSQVWFSRVSGVIILLLGVYQLGVFKRPAALEREYRLPFRLDRFAMNPLVALVLGFTFSFAWTPCVGPTLSSVLLMASLLRLSGHGVSAHRRLYAGLCAAVSGGGLLYRHCLELLQIASECGALHGEDRRGAVDCHGRDDPDRLFQPSFHRTKRQGRGDGILRKFFGEVFGGHL